MVVTDAQFSGLSGEVDALQADVLDNSRIIMGLPTKTDFNNFEMYSSQRFNTIEDSVDLNTHNIESIIDYIHSLRFLYEALQSSFTGQTGLVKTLSDRLDIVEAQLSGLEN